MILHYGRGLIGRQGVPGVRVARSGVDESGCVTMGVGVEEVEMQLRRTWIVGRRYKDALFLEVDYRKL